jgi:putative DNA primase/helicase
LIHVRAADYAAFGLRIFPCHSIKNGRCTCGKMDCTSKGKHPRVNGWQNQATADSATIQAWTAEFGEENINWALACGLGSGLWVVDIDPKKSGYESWELFEEERGEPFITLKSRTGGGGRHLFFKTDGRPVPNKVGWLPGVDIRGDGGYVILPQGRHASGGTYEWIDWGDTPPAEAPDVLQSLRSVGTGSSNRTERQDWSDVLRGVPEGQRDDTLFAFACYLRRKLDDQRALVEPLVVEAAKNCDPPFSEEEALKKVDQAFKQDHSDPAWMEQWAARFEGKEIPEGQKVYTETDLGNAQRFVNAHKNDVLFVPAWGWLEKTDIGWSNVPDEVIEDKAKGVADLIRADAIKQQDNSDRLRMFKFSLKTEQMGAITALVRAARSDPAILRNPDQFDRDDYVLSCRNGILDLRTGRLRAYTDADLITKNTFVRYDPSFVLPQWDKFLDDATQGDRELKDYLQRAAGYTLTGLTQEECFFIISGPPASGKSTYIDAVYGALGLYAMTSQSDVFMYRRGKDAASNELARLVGARMVAVSEIREGEYFNESIVKQITGGDKISARMLYQNTFTFTPQFKLWIATNHDPSAQDAAMMRRIKKIQFDHIVPRELRDPKLKSILRDPEVGGRAVLAWAARGAQMYLEEGKLVEPFSITAAVHAYKTDNDVFGLFISEVFDTVEGSAVDVVTAYGQHTTWSLMNGERTLNRPRFKQRLLDRGYKLVRDDRGREAFLGLRVKSMSVEVR